MYRQHETRRYRQSRVRGLSNFPGAMLTTARIPILERVELPESWIPADSRVEIDAKITAGKLPATPKCAH